MRWRISGRAAVVVVGIVIGLAGCGGGGTGPTTPPTPPPAPPPQPSIVRADTADIEVGFAILWYFYAGEKGTIEATVDYTHEDSDVRTWILRGECEPEAFVAGQCEIVVAEPTGPDPRVLSAGEQPEGTYTLVAWNGGPLNESVSIRVYVTVSR